MPVKHARRVLITADTVGGVWTCAVELANALAAHGVRSAVATMGAPLRESQRAELTASVEVFESTYKLEWMDAPWEDVERAGSWLLRIEQKVRPDVVHLNQFAFGALPFNAPTVVVAHSCVYSWWRAVHGCAPPATWARYEQTLIHALAACDRVAAPTHAMLQSLRENYGYSGNGIVVPNGRTAEHFVIGPKAAVIFTAGRLWDDAKNLRALEAIAPQLPWPVVVAGATDHPDGSFRQTQGVVALGELTGAAMKRELSRAAIYALPARYEPFGLSALEAALAGCALVLGDIPSLREVWGPAALYVQPDDHAALHAALSLLIRDSAQRRSYAKAARARAVKFTPQRMAKAYVALYEAACAREALARGGQRDSLTRPENSTCAS